MDGLTDVRLTDGHTDVQCETIIPLHYRVVGYENISVKNVFYKTNENVSFAKQIIL